MKVLFLLFTFSLISGPVSCSEVIGYSGGTVIINCKYYRQLHRDHKYFCEISTKQCVYLDQTENTWSHKGRVDLYDNPGVLTVIYRNLRLQDAGSYQCGETVVWGQDVNLKVNEDPCCLGSKTVTGYLGETITISCSSPEQEEGNYKTFYKHDDQEVIHSTENQKGRFSISDNRESKVLSVRIRDVREDDGGVYYCGVWKEGEPVSYSSLYTEIQLQVTAPGSSIIIITVCVCVVLLLIGGSALIFYRLRCRRTQDSASTSTRPGANETVDTDYENDPPGKRNIINITPVYQNLNPNTNQSDLVYQSLDPGSREPNSVYYSPVSCSEVIGYSGGTVIINCKYYRQLRRDHKYFCEISTKQCMYLDQTENTWSHKGRVDLYDNPGVLTVIYRNLRLQDAGSYQCGEAVVWGQDVNLNVNEDPCCSESKTVTGYLGETVTISCSYPEQEEGNYKLLYKQDDQDFKEVIHSTENQKGRFSISDNRESRVLNVRISDVREDDGGVYYCGVWKEGVPVRYASLYTEIQLQVTGGRTVLIAVYVCVVLLLIGGSVLIFYVVMRLKKHQDPASSSSTLLQVIKQPTQVASGASNSEKIQPPGRVSALAVAAPPSDSSDTNISSSVQPPNDQDPTYTTAQPTRLQQQHRQQLHLENIRLVGQITELVSALSSISFSLKELKISNNDLQDSGVNPLILGPVSSFSVTGYSGGIVMIFCSHYGWHNRTKYFCGTSTKQCVYLDQTQNRWSHKGRVDLYDHPRGLTVIYRNLSLQDTGSYRCGETGVWSHVLNLKVNEGPCCSGRKTETVYLGKTVAISCSYPEEFKTNIKFLYKQDGKDLTEAISTTVPQRGRFSISDNRSSEVVSVRISDVREYDGGVYYCGMWNGEESVSSFSFFKEIQLHVTGSSIIIIIIITVCVCVVLLLIGGSALIFYRLRCRRTQVMLLGGAVGLSSSASYQPNQIEEQKETQRGAALTAEENRRKLLETEDWNLPIISQAGVQDEDPPHLHPLPDLSKHIKTKTYFCTNATEQCVYLKANQTQNTWVHEDRLSVSGFIGGLIVTYRNLSLQDAGQYRYGETGVWSHNVNLKVDS
ncbi:hypothetical protein NFI96_018797, partial [Prochilodus magdalenae]